MRYPEKNCIQEFFDDNLYWTNNCIDAIPLNTYQAKRPFLNVKIMTDPYHLTTALKKGVSSKCHRCYFFAWNPRHRRLMICQNFLQLSINLSIDQAFLSLQSKITIVASRRSWQFIKLWWQWSSSKVTHQKVAQSFVIVFSQGEWKCGAGDLKTTKF